MFGILFFWKYYFSYFRHYFTHLHQCTSEFFFNFRFSSRKSQSQKKLAKKDESFYNTVSQKKPHKFHFTNFNSLDIANNMLPRHSQKPLTLQSFQQTCFCLVSEKTFALHHFWMRKNCFLEALWKQMSVYFCISPWENFAPEM